MNERLKLGEHLILELSNCNRDILMVGEKSYALFAHAVRQSGLTVVGEGFHKFSPHGFTCYLLLAESHASLHAWPEHAYCAIDIFTCSIGKDLMPLIRRLQDVFEAEEFALRKFDREASVESPVPVAI